MCFVIFHQNPLRGLNIFQFTYAQAAGQDDIPVAQVVGLPYEYGKPFVTEDEEINLGTQLIGLIMREILDPKGEFYHDGPINRVASASTS
jgi:hypothetical protein